jgi:hypothetical protein
LRRHLKFTTVHGKKIQVVGDDIFVTNTRYIARGIKEGTANSELIKLNQIGTVSETIEAVRMCRFRLALFPVAPFWRKRRPILGRFRRYDGWRAPEDRIGMPKRTNC